MYAIAVRILRDADLAQDALQGALVTAWRQLPNLRDPARFEAWVRRLLIHSCYAEARRRRSWTANVRILPVDGPAHSEGVSRLGWSVDAAGTIHLEQIDQERRDDSSTVR